MLVERFIQLLNLNEYSESIVAAQLSKLVINNFFDREHEKLSNLLSLFIEGIRNGDIKPDENGSVFFGEIQKMEKNDFDEESYGIFSNFREHIIEEFNRLIKICNSKDRLLGDSKGSYDSYSIEDSLCFDKKITVSPKEYSDLCVISLSTLTGVDKSYIRTGDLYYLLLSKGLSEKEIMPIFLDMFNQNRLDEKKTNHYIFVKYSDIVKEQDSKHKYKKV